MSTFTTRARSFTFAALLAISGAAAAETTVLRLSDLFPAAYPFGAAHYLSSRGRCDAHRRKVEVQVFPRTCDRACAMLRGRLQGTVRYVPGGSAYTAGRFR